MKKILVLGAYGFLGSSLCPILKNFDFNIIKHGRQKESEVYFNMKNLNDVQKNLEILDPDVVVNLIAFTNVDECEKKKNEAETANIKIVKTLTEAIKNVSKKKNLHLIHISTDQVYNGKGLHTEDKVNPINFYGKSKHLGEREASKINSTILRVNFIGKSNKIGKKSLSDWIVESLRKKTKINVFKDVIFSPLHISNLCKNIVLVIDKQLNGIFNVGSCDGISKADFAFRLGKLLNLDEKLINPINFNQAKLLADRPLNMCMNVKKYEKMFKVSLGDVKEQIILTANDYK